MASASLTQIRANAESVQATAGTLDLRIAKQLPEFRLEAELTAPPGVTILFGQSGSGKTTVLKCIAGLLMPDEGRITAGARVLFDSKLGIDLAAGDRAVGYLFQSLALFPHLTVEQNVLYGLAGTTAAEKKIRTTEILESFRIAHLLSRKPGGISGGERQRVALARSLVTRPAVLLLDEPLSALDAITKSDIVEDLRAWNAARGIPIIYVTHSYEEAFALGESVVVVDAGKILARGTPHQVLQTPRHETVAQLAGFENVFDATVASVNEQWGTMICRIKPAGQELEVPLGRVSVGSPIRIAIRAGDIMLATDVPHGLSARNIIRGRLTSLDQQGSTVIGLVEAGAVFKAHLTPSARDELQLHAGEPIWLVIKTYSCHLVSPPR